MSPVVAIDGPGGSGKSTVSRELAARLGVERLDTGAMYRAVTHGVLRRGVDPADSAAVAASAAEVHFTVDDRVVVDGEDATTAIRGPEVTAAVSAVSEVPAVRDLLVERQRTWVAERGGGVVEGRDIGTVVLPDADLKVFLTASPAVRAQRRQRDEAASRRQVEVGAVLADLERRDRHDAGRAMSPMAPAADAVVIATDDMQVGEVVDRILGELATRQGGDG